MVPVTTNQHMFGLMIFKAPLQLQCASGGLQNHPTLGDDQRDKQWFWVAILYNVRPPSDVCWFINPHNYSYKYHKP